MTIDLWSLYALMLKSRLFEESVTQLWKDGSISAAVLDLKTVAPIDKATRCEKVAQTGRLLVLDEDYEGFGLSGEVAAVLLEADIPFKYARVCTQNTIPYARSEEDLILRMLNVSERLS